MKVWTRAIGALFLVLGIYACGKPVTSEEVNAETDQMPGEAAAVPPEGLVEIKGFAGFGSHCPYGMFSPPSPVPLEMYDCPIPQPSLELSEDLQPIVFQIDCKKRTIDLRGMRRDQESTSWEFMPDGSFRLTVDAGYAKFKDDQSGNVNCAAPLKADLWGMIDCTDRDNAKIKVETVWWVGQSVQPSPTPSGTRTPRPGTTPSPSPSVSSSPIPSSSPVSSPSFTPLPSITVLPTPSISIVPVPLPSIVIIPAPPGNPTGNPNWAAPEVPRGLPGYSSCKLPPGCYLHTITKLNQCS